MDYNNFLKSIQIPENTITLMNNSNYSSEHQKSLPNLENNTNIYIFAMNHNQVFLDLKSMRIAADYFKVKNFYTINNSSFWPSFCLTGNTDPTFMHIQMPDLYHKLLKKTETDSQSTLIFIYPEGDLPFQSINMPLVSNLGAFIYARRFANYFKNKRNVYLIEAFSNYIDVKNINFQPTIVIDSIEKVPDRPIELNDCWAFKKRLNFENKSNLFRQIPFHTINNLKETFCDKQVI